MMLCVLTVWVALPRNRDSNRKIGLSRASANRSETALHSVARFGHSGHTSELTDESFRGQFDQPTLGSSDSEGTKNEKHRRRNQRTE